MAVPPAGAGRRASGREGAAGGAGGARRRAPAVTDDGAVAAILPAPRVARLRGLAGDPTLGARE